VSDPRNARILVVEDETKIAKALVPTRLALVKPFAFPQLLARIRALLRRGRTEPETLLSCADHHFPGKCRPAMGQAPR